jgi:hypothetical protein
MAYTKDIARHDRIWIDGVDVSNAFREFGFSSEHSEEDVSGFSVSGVDEILPGSTAQGFSGEAFYTPEFYAVLWPLHRDREVVEIQWQPDGLIDPTREVYYGNCTINTFNPTATRGAVRVMQFTAKPADENGIQAAAGT